MIVILIIKHLQRLEHELKSILPGLAQSYGLSPYALTQPQVRTVLESMAPIGLEKVEPDIHYICQLLLNKPPGLFDHVQEKQWLSYLNEMEPLLRFLCLHPLTNETSINYFRLNDQITFSIPFKKFMESLPCSHNNFSRLINALNKFVIGLYICASTLCVEFIKALPQVPPPQVPPPQVPLPNQ